MMFAGCQPVLQHMYSDMVLETFHVPGSCASCPSPLEPVCALHFANCVTSCGVTATSMQERWVHAVFSCLQSWISRCTGVGVYEPL